VVEYIHYSIQYLESNFNIFYDDVLLNNVKYEKLLGITIDNCLSWCQQINNNVNVRYGIRREVHSGIICTQI
jgi:hypothetical protein